MAFYTNRFVLDGAAPADIMTADDWVQVTVISSAAGVTITHKQASTGVPIPADTPVWFYMAPGAKIWANGPASATLGVIVQPLPLNLKVMRMITFVLEKMLPPSLRGDKC